MMTLQNTVPYGYITVVTGRSDLLCMVLHAFE